MTPYWVFSPGPHWVTSVPQDTFPFASFHPPKVTEALTPLQVVALISSVLL